MTETMKAYISCPLEAALAIKNHGFKFERSDLWLGKDTPVWCGEGDFTGIWNQEKYFIAPESYSLLRVQKRDKLENPYGRIKYVCGDDEGDLFQHSNEFISLSEALRWGCLMTIIRREYKPFPKIRYQNAKD